jgi:radical SAM superfamily enzyme YgiQ (UPF0313 family)
MSVPPHSSYSDWYERAYPGLTGHGLWLHGNEINTLPAAEYGLRPFRILIARLSTYYDTAESFSHKVLYQIARRRGDTFPDFAYLPPVNDGPILAADGVPWLLGTSSKRGPKAFDCVAFSNALVVELVNVLAMLARSGIPLEKSARMDDDSLPLVIMGGSNAHAATAFFVPDPPVDGIFAGESVECISRIFAICAEAKQAHVSKRETLALLEDVPGFVQPDGKRATRRIVEVAPALNALLEDAPVFNIDEQYGRGNLQISEGCACFCGFCSESFCRKPYREVAAGEAAACARRMKAAMGLSRMELYSFNFNMYSQLGSLCATLADLGLTPGLKSQRFDMLARDPHLLDLLRAVGKSSLTCGLEGISSRLRRYLHKSLSEDDVRASISRIVSSPLRELKVFLIVTGLEEGRDVSEFDGLVRFIKERAAESLHGPRVIFSVTPLVRFPWTPLEFEDAPLPETLRPIVASIRGAVAKHGFEFRMSSNLSYYHLSQILARASDPRVYAGLTAAFRSTGYVYYRSVPSSFVDAFVTSCEERGLSHLALLSGHAHDDESKPWLRVQTGIDREFLKRRHDDARAFIDNGFCLGNPASAGSCTACGACDQQGKAALCEPRPNPEYPARLFAALRPAAPAETGFVVDVSDSCRGLPRESFGVALARAIMLAVPGAVASYAGYCRSLWAASRQPCWITGHDIVVLAWRAQGGALVETAMSDLSCLAKINAALGTWGTVAGPAGRPPARRTIVARSPFAFDPRAYCAGNGLPYTLRKTGESAYACDFGPKAAKKKIIRSLAYAKNPAGGTDISMTVLDKFDPAEFVRESFAFEHENDWVRVRIEARFTQ